MTIRDLLASLVRTLVPTVVGLILSLLAKAELEVDSGLLSGVLDALFVGGYYALVRVLESRWSVAGVLLGWKVQPTYPK